MTIHPPLTDDEIAEIEQQYSDHDDDCTVPRLISDLKAAREALKPFAKIGDEIGGTDQDFAAFYFLIGQFRAASAALPPRKDHPNV